MAEKKLSLEYLKEAVMEPANFWGMAGFAVAAAYTWSPIPLAAALVAEGAYLATVPASSLYRRLVDGRNRKRLAELRNKQRERLIESFDPREREAVLYLKWLKNKIFDNYVKFTGAKDLPTNIRSLDQRWEDFVDLLDVYRRRKHDRVIPARIDRTVAVLDVFDARLDSTAEQVLADVFGDSASLTLARGKEHENWFHADRETQDPRQLDAHATACT